MLSTRKYINEALAASRAAMIDSDKYISYLEDQVANHRREIYELLKKNLGLRNLTVNLYEKEIQKIERRLKI